MVKPPLCNICDPPRAHWHSEGHAFADTPSAPRSRIVEGMQDAAAGKVSRSTAVRVKPSADPRDEIITRQAAKIEKLQARVAELEAGAGASKPVTADRAAYMREYRKTHPRGKK